MTFQMKRAWLAAALALFALALPMSAAQAFEPSNTECIAPAAPGGGWDFTCRQVGKTLQDLKLVPGTMQVTNLAGGGGGVAYAEVVSKRNKDDNLIVAASSATATRLAPGRLPGQQHGPGALGRLDRRRLRRHRGRQGLPIKTLPELMDKIKADPTSVSFAGGSAVGGWDHLKVLIAAKAAGIDDVRTIKYVPFDGGGEAVTQLLGGLGAGLHRRCLGGQGLRRLRRYPGARGAGAGPAAGRLPRFPTAKEQGIDAVGANWRGFYAPGGMSDDAYKFWVGAIDKVYASDEWKKIMAQNGLAPLDLSGDEFQAFVEESIANIQTISKEIGLIK